MTRLNIKHKRKVYIYELLVNIMEIDKLPDNLPKTKEKIEAAFEDCNKEKRVQIKQKTFVNSAADPRAHLDSATRALAAAKVLFDNTYFEWVIVPAYSAMYQEGNAILIKELGKECRDHFCLLISLLKLKKIGLDEAEGLLDIKERLDRLSDDAIQFASKLRLARSTIIYKPSARYNEIDIAEAVINRAESFVEAAMKVIS